jgi:hypothetical protein
MLHPFGYGLQYNTWCLGQATLSASDHHGTMNREVQLPLAGLEIAAAVAVSGLQMSEEVARVAIRAWHFGSFAASSVVVMCYAIPPAGISGKGGHPIKTLVGFQRLALESASPPSFASAIGGKEGGSDGVTVDFSLPRKAFLLADAAGKWRGKRGLWTIVVEVGSELHFEQASATLNVV